MKRLKKVIKKIGVITAIGALVGVSFLGGCVTEKQRQEDDAAITCEPGTVLNEDGTVCLPVAVEPVSSDVAKPVEMEPQVSFIIESMSDDFEYGELVHFEVDKYDLKNLAKGEVDVNGKDYKYTERLIANFKLATGLDKRQYGDSLRLMSEDKKAIQGLWHFHKPVPISEIDEDELVIDIANKKVKIVSIDASEMTYQDATEIVLVAGKPKTIDDVEVNLLGVNQYGVAKIQVGDEILILYMGDEDKVNGLQVKYLRGVDDVAKIIAGKDIRKTVPLGGEFEDYADGTLVEYKYFWEMDGEGNLENFGYVSNIKWNDVTDKNNQKAPELGEPINLPNEYGSIVMESKDDADLKTYSVEVEDGFFSLSGSFEVDGEDYSGLLVNASGDLLDINEEPLSGVVELLDSELVLEYSGTTITIGDVVITADLVENDLVSVMVLDNEMVDSEYNLMNYRGDVVDAIDKDENSVDLQIRDSDDMPEVVVRLEITKKKVELVPKEPVLVTEELVIEEPVVE